MACLHGMATDRRAFCITGPARCSVHVTASWLLVPEGRAREKCMTEPLSARHETIAAGSASCRHHVHDRHSEATADLRRVGIHPDFWYPVAVSSSVRKNKTFAATFAGERIALYRGESGTVYALEDRCAHRQVPLSMGVVEGEVAPLLLSRLGLSREWPYFADTVSAQGRRPAAARCPRLPGPRSLWPGLRLSRRSAKGHHDSATRAAGIRFRRAQDHDVFSHRAAAITRTCTRISST